MNYKLLIFISVFIIIIALIGLLSGDKSTPAPVAIVSSEESSPKESTPKESSLPLVETKQILVAEALVDIFEGQILQKDHYKLVNKIVATTAAETAYDMSAMGTLTNYLTMSSIKAGQLINPNMVVSPNADQYTLLLKEKSKERVVYSLPLLERERFLLQNLRAGDFVSLYIQSNCAIEQYHKHAQKGYASTQIECVNKSAEAGNEQQLMQLFLPHVNVVVTKKSDLFNNLEQGSGGKTVGEISVSLQIAELLALLQLRAFGQIIILPYHEDTATQNSELLATIFPRKEARINQLRGH